MRRIRFDENDFTAKRRLSIFTSKNKRMFRLKNIYVRKRSIYAVIESLPDTAGPPNHVLRCHVARDSGYEIVRTLRVGMASELYVLPSSPPRKKNVWVTTATGVGRNTECTCNVCVCRRPGKNRRSLNAHAGKPSFLYRSLDGRFRRFPSRWP